MNVVIVDCLTVGTGRRRFSRDFIGGGPRLIAGVLNRIGIENLKIKIVRAEDVFLKISSFVDYDICLISAMSMDFISVQNVLRLWRKDNGERITILGGPIASDLHILERIKCDIAIWGEGEKKIFSIFNILKDHNLKINTSALKMLKIIKGISILHAEKVFLCDYSSEKLSLEDFNEFSEPKLNLKYIKHYENYKSAKVYVECLRGCSNYFRIGFPIKKNKRCLEQQCNKCRKVDTLDRMTCPLNIPPGCGFCSTVSNFGFPKSRSTKKIISEIRGLLSLGIKRIVLGGPDFLDYKREAFSENRALTNPRIPPEPNYIALNALINQIVALRQVKNNNAQIFIENVKASLCTEEALKILSKIPNSIFSIGCETGSEEFAKLLGRPFGPKETIKAVKNAIIMGIRVHVYFIHSLLGEKEEYLMESIELIKEFYDLGVEKITIYKYQDFPGTPFYALENKKALLRGNDKKIIRYRKKLVRTAINFNRERKMEMIGKNYEIILSEIDFHDKNNAIGYIIKGGPKVLIKNAASYLGNQVNAKIINVFSDKLVEGVIKQ